MESEKINLSLSLTRDECQSLFTLFHNHKILTAHSKPMYEPEINKTIDYCMNEIEKALNRK